MRFQKNDKKASCIQTKMKMRKSLHLFEMAYYVINAYRGFGIITDENQLFESCSEIFYVSCVFVELLREAAENTTDIEDEQNNENRLNSFQASNDRLGALLMFSRYLGRSCMTVALHAKCLSLLTELDQFLSIILQISKKKMSNIF